ncbi:MAG: TonB-dependent receptor [Pseudomonadota bacterium]
MNIGKCSQYLVLTAAAVLASLPAKAPAQGLEEIVVTAQRRAQDISDVPLAVSAYTPEALEDLQIKSAVDLVDLIPNLQGGNNTALGSATMYYLRGQGQDESFPTFDPAVGTYVDEVFVSRQNANNFSFFDVERIEILRGPQGTLFGKNNTGGAINIIMAKPTDEFGASIEAGFGRFDRRSIRGSVNLPINEQASALLSAFYVEDDGWVENTVTGEDLNAKDATGFRGALVLDLTDRISWYLTADYVDDSQTNITGTLAGDDVVSTSVLSRGLDAVYPGVISKAPYGNSAESFNFTSNLSWGTEFGDFNLIVGSRQLDQDFLVNFPLPDFGAFLPDSPEDVFIIDNLGEYDQVSVELKWVNSFFDDRLNLVSGLFYLDEDNTTDVAAHFASATPSRDRIIGNTTENLAIYAQGDIALSDQWTATVGLRFTSEEKEFEVTDNRPVGDITDLTSANLDGLGIPRTIDEDIVTPRFALSYKPSDSAMFYGSATRGFRTGGWNARGNTAAGLLPFESETAWSYELGSKLQPSDKVGFNATAFFLQIEDLQINTSTGGGTFLIGNAGEMENLGFEIELFLQPTDRFSAFLAGGLQDAEYKPDAAEIAACTIPNAAFGAFDENCNVAEVKRSPDWSVSLGGAYDIPIASLRSTLQFRASFSATPDHITTSRNRGPSGSYQLFNVGAELSADDGAWSAVIECANCDNERYVQSTFGSGDLYYNVPGRWEARFRYNFGGRR